MAKSLNCVFEFLWEPCMRKYVFPYRYQLLVVGYNPVDPADESDNPCVEVRANFFSDDRHTSASTGNAYDEVQKIKVTSETVPERQVLYNKGLFGP